MDWTTNLKRLEHMANRFRMMSDPTRLQILAVLEEQELSVQDICDRTGYKQSNVSKHLRVLREIGAIACTQRSYYHYYRVIDPQILSCWRCTKTACNESGEPYVKADSEIDAELPSACDQAWTQAGCHDQFQPVAGQLEPCHGVSRSQHSQSQ
ncbi:metalloregulator ArsR/SmtB family transcription factor [Thermoleptolyngbya sp. PKUAC-SCTB121]|uniref:ArsR/SmtB family transcription factor n=1 Tax=Thermoleptolyngbya sp. PKUAC-SCTB121 TaxID=2811482 RepID=UPI0028F42E50|nr:metalloregulator ArsR/SmtB family transcription factor [Thermoleptolyngbya sp. PKUAC-SCTB121]